MVGVRSERLGVVLLYGGSACARYGQVDIGGETDAIAHGDHHVAQQRIVRADVRSARGGARRQRKPAGRAEKGRNELPAVHGRRVRVAHQSPRLPFLAPARMT